jgi:MoxR-like ATPase
MHSAVTVTPAQLPDLLLQVAVVRPVFVWGAPGIGKSSLVRAFAESLGLDCLFLDELNASSPEVQKAFYSLILDRRIGGYELPAGSIVIGAGNRAGDNALARPMASALINRLVHVHLRASHTDWLNWAPGAGVHPWVLAYLDERPDHLWAAPPKTEEVFSTPRSWHMLSDALRSHGDDIAEETLRLLAAGTLSPRARGRVLRLPEGRPTPVRPGGHPAWRRRLAAACDDRDVLYFLAETFRPRLVRELPGDKDRAPAAVRRFAHRAKGLLVELAEISLECGQLVIAADPDGAPVLPTWFLVEVSRDLPRLVAARA